jgi:alanine racemase
LDYHRLYSGVPTLHFHRVWAEIDIDALKNNFQKLRKKAPDSRKICVVKADAYGHTSAICVSALLDAGCDFFAVSCLEEAIEVKTICRRKGAGADVIILGYTAPSFVHQLVEYDVIQTIVSERHAIELSRAAERESITLRTHVSLDTGMNRIGICARNKGEIDSAAQSICSIANYSGISVEGIFTHLARADEDYDEVTAPDSSTSKQLEGFIKVKNILEAKGLDLFCHVCNSAATTRFPNFHFDGVRLGILLYGISPSSYIVAETEPVMSLHTVISHVHKLPEGEAVSYGGEFVSDKDSLVATLPIGYADGFLRAYSGETVTVHTESGNYKAPVIGRVCMDQCMIDVTGLPVNDGNGVAIFGDEATSLSSLAKAADTIEYECLCLVSGRVPRIAKMKK